MCHAVPTQEMDAADFRGLVSDQWHVGVVGTAQLQDSVIHVFYNYNTFLIPELPHSNLTLRHTAEDSVCRLVLFFATVAGASSESKPEGFLCHHSQSGAPSGLS
jgi:hypothetical protein